ncbi:hypothetical protein [Sinorhizobium fredii]|uniref:hypothetical protein n=1 Tax=Rhizobium fredii TaxID=380 RepID=UPI00030B9802|nr:hypothetical protein [Sinorhizobium fredii]
MTDKRARHRYRVLGSVWAPVVFGLLLCLADSPARAAPASCRSWFNLDPVGKIESQDTTAALFEPDCYAWQLFVALNWPAKPNSCEPDSSRKLGDDGPVVWETWISKQNVFLKDAKAPPAWDDHCGGQTQAKELFPTAQIQAVIDSLPVVAPGLEVPGGDFSNAADEEVRLNRSALTFIRDETLYSLTTQRKKASSGQRKIDFPPLSKEVKAHWVKLTDPADFSRYHTGVDKTGTVFGLAALHITTKDLPNWYWATFEHVDNKDRWPAQHQFAFAGWVVPPRDSFACGTSPPDCQQFPVGVGLEGTKWQFYRLKATQVDWVDSFGEPTKVVNSKIEGFFNQEVSSCISCHALARIGENSGPMPYSIINPEGPSDGSGRPANFIGVVGKNDLRPGPGAGAEMSNNFLQLDFVWSLRNACPEPDDPNRTNVGGHC